MADQLDIQNLVTLSWKELRDKKVDEFKINNISPEELCLQSNCNCTFHFENLNNSCIFFIKGICPNIICTKQHQIWEDYKLNGITSNQQTRKACSILNKVPVEPYEPTPQFLQKQQLQRLQEATKEKQKIDIIFIMDCTLSMCPWMKRTKNQIATIIEKFKILIESKKRTIRLGFVGYRDFDVLENQQIVYHDLTCDIEAVKNFISIQEPIGGCDQAENVYSGIKRAYELNISKHPESLLVTFLFADAPTHGRQYHNQEVDDSESEIEEGILEQLMQEYQKLKIKNFFYCVKINKTTDIMYNIMKQNFKELTITESVKPEKFEDLVQFSLIDSFQKSEGMIAPANIVIKAKFQKPKILSYEEQNGDKKSYWKDFINNINSALRYGQTSITIEQQQQQFSTKDEQGMQCQVFFMKDSKNNRKMLAKIPKQVIVEFEQTGYLSQETIKKAEQLTRCRFNSLVIAKQLAFIYRQKTKKIKGAPPIFYVSPIIYKLETPFKGLNELYAETYIDLPNVQWKKYSNNAAFIIPEHFYLTSFSHFSHEETEGMILITDLQGKKNILSDPCIQTIVRFNTDIYKDMTNMHQNGIDLFKNRLHTQCSFICDQLNLNKYKNMPFLNQSKFDLRKEELLFAICDTCDEFSEISQKVYEEQSNYTLCEHCVEDEKQLDKMTCKCCKKKFYFPYQIWMKVGTILNLCRQCKQQCLNQTITNSCYYCELQCNVNTYIKNLNIWLCQKSKKYLDALFCFKCTDKYKYNKLLNQEQYLKGEYICDVCQFR